MPTFDDTSTYHGTSDVFANDLVSGSVNTTVGGGEFGQGFYLGTELHVAKAWAKQKFGTETVVEFRMKEEDFWTFEIEALDQTLAIEHREHIKSTQTQRSFTFGKDVVWGPIVGGPKLYCDQHKWESKRGQSYLNGPLSLKIIR
ncbi:hypothetical protein AB9F26_19225 [Falsihalocynthiibacter sp. BN13B15]|uniref:hypothetical protein n=1 Tax=Falsihalocynthiibacter sp. BN13B15 TaxID=3240871 RepID=UPI00350F715D